MSPSDPRMLRSVNLVSFNFTTQQVVFQVVDDKGGITAVEIPCPPEQRGDAWPPTIDEKSTVACAGTFAYYRTIILALLHSNTGFRFIRFGRINNGYGPRADAWIREDIGEDTIKRLDFLVDESSTQHSAIRDEPRQDGTYLHRGGGRREDTGIPTVKPVPKK